MSLNLISPTSTVKSTPPVYNPFPIPQKDDESTWQTYLKESADRIEGEYVKDARIIILGNRHNEPWQNAWRRGIMERYGSKSSKDIVLCEGIEACKEIVHAPKSLRPIDNSPFSLREKMNFYGWENITLHRSSIDAAIKLASLYEKYKTSPSSVTWSKSDITTFQALNQQIRKESLQRNISLITTTTSMYKTLKPNQKLFVIAGSTHLLKKGKSSSDEYNILNSFPDMNACLITPKQMLTTTFADQMQYAKKIKTENALSKETPKLPPKASDSSVATPKETDKNTSSKETTKSVSDSSAIIPSASSKKKKRKETNSFSSQISSKKPGPSLKIEP